MNKNEQGSKRKMTKKKGTWKPEKGVPSRFPKGTSGNPNGRPKGTKNKFSIAELADAIHTVEKKKKKKLLEYYVEQAFAEPQILISIMKKLLPDLRSIEGMLGVGTFTMSDEEAERIQNKLRQRWANNNGKGS